ncbi:MAG: succinate dehydrogenase, hydrophobic membrane anchor protein [Rhodospirillales bacterium]|jgi:succinate dehydrogenase / fumarate reductase membrane anchor subunit
MEMRSPLARVRGLGSAKEGVEHWWVQRITSIALVPLVIWFIFSVPTLIGTDHAAFRIWISHHGNLVLMVLLVSTLFHHAQLGMQVVIEDYVHGKGTKVASILLVKLIAILCAVSSLIALLHVAFST